MATMHNMETKAQETSIISEQISVPVSSSKSCGDSVPCSTKPESKMIISPSIFEEKLWGQYDLLHKRLLKKIECYENYFKKFEAIKNAFSEIMKILKNTDFKFESSSNFLISIPRVSLTEKEFEKLTRDVPSTIISIKCSLEDQIEESNRTIQNILLIFSNFIKQMKDEKKEYDDFQRYLNNYNYMYNEEKKIIDKNMKLYHQKGKLAEKSVLDYKKLELNSNSPSDAFLIEKSENKAKEFVNEYLKPFNIYKESVNKANDLRNEFIKKQNNLLDIYYDLEDKTDILNSDIIQIFIQSSKNQMDLSKENMDDFKEMKTNINKGQNIEELINEFGKNKIISNEIKLIYFPSGIDFDICDNSKTFNAFLETILYIRKINKDEYPNFNEKVESEKNDMREIVSRLFEKYTEEDELKLIDYINNPEKHNTFFVILNKFRNCSCLNNNIKLIDTLGKILNIILNKAFVNKNYEVAKNCIIFSKTFFYNSEDNIRHFLLEKIRNHEWLTKKEFWTNFILININQELNKFLSFYKDITISDIEKINEKITDKIKNKLSELLFSQILPYVSNMSEFNISNTLISEIIVEFCSKYRYLNEEKIEGILSIVFKEKKEVNNIKENVRDFLLPTTKKKEEKEGETESETGKFERGKRKRSNIHIKYEHLKKIEKQVEDTL